MKQFTPFRLEANLEERIWGGSRLGNHTPPYGEAWIACDRSRVLDGPFTGELLGDLARRFPVELLGQHVFEMEGARFPLLIKLLDPGDWLSVQVHPDDVLAHELEGVEFRGKTEAWYVLEAEPGAEVIAGIRPGIASSDVADVIRHGSLEPLLKRQPVRAGDALLIEAGLIHALGPGLFIYEVQQNSDLTYRVSDWGRPASAGRALHLEQSARAVKSESRPYFAPMIPTDANGSIHLLGCQYFDLQLVQSDGKTIERDTSGHSFEVVTVIDGDTSLDTNENHLELQRYETALVPASTGNYRFERNEPFRILISSVP